MSFTWKIQLFAGLSERIGLSLIQYELPMNSLSVAQLKLIISSNHPEHEALINLSFIAANHQYRADEHTIHYDEELALLPPVSGGDYIEASEDAPLNESNYVITYAPILADQVLQKVICKENGASLLFVGSTREYTEGKRTITLDYDAYIPMAVAMMKQIGEEIASKWQGAKCAITHRIGRVELSEISVIIAVSTPHRSHCYEASRYAIERLKQIVPIWKKEIWDDGSEWIGHQLGPWNPLQPNDEESKDEFK